MSRRFWRLAAINVASVAVSFAAFHFFPGPATWVLSAWLVALPIYWNLHSLASSPGVRPDMAAVLGQLFIPVVTVGVAYCLLRGAEPRYLIPGCYFAALAGSWVYKIAYRQGAKDGVAELNRRMTADSEAAAAQRREQEQRLAHLRTFHRQPGSRGRIINVDPRDEP